MSALDEVRDRYGFPTAIVTMEGDRVSAQQGVRGRVVIDDAVKAASCVRRVRRALGAISTKRKSQLIGCRDSFYFRWLSSCCGVSQSRRLRQPRAGLLKQRLQGQESIRHRRPRELCRASVARRSIAWLFGILRVGVCGSGSFGSGSSGSPGSTAFRWRADHVVGGHGEPVGGRIERRRFASGSVCHPMNSWSVSRACSCPALLQALPQRTARSDEVARVVAVAVVGTV